MRSRIRGCAISLRSGAAQTYLSAEATRSYLPHLGHSTSGTEQGSSTDKLSRILGQTVEQRTRNNQSGADKDGGLASKALRDPGRDEDGEEGWEEKGRGNQAEPLALRVVKVLVPLRQGLQSTEEGLVITDVEDAETAADAVQHVLPHAAVAPPMRGRVVCVLTAEPH